MKGLGGEIQRIAIAQLIQGISIAKINLSESDIQQYFDFVEEAFKTTILEIHDKVNIAFEPFCHQYLRENPSKYTKFVDVFIGRIEKEIIKDVKKSFC